MPLSAEVIRSLQPYDLRVMRTLERLMHRFEWVPLDDLKTATRFSGSELAYRLGRLIGRGLVRYEKVPYEGYTLVYAGLDTLALRALTSRGTLRALGTLTGEGKESVVYEGLGLAPVAIKLHHVGQRSFQSVRRNRDYLPDHTNSSWLQASRLSAEREFGALTLLHPRVPVPAPVAIDRNAVVMDLVGGATLNRCRLDDPGTILDEIVAGVRTAYRLGAIHNDLSEFNVMMDGERVVLIDWPQWVTPEHPNARAILENDLGNVLAHFTRKYRLNRDLDGVVDSVVG
ncbi:MAG: serine/threonine protein phosphatase [Methanospirillum sp.]|nr:serine/threonine protein phosphatase [Methanospirillum sp.]